MGEVILALSVVDGLLMLKWLLYLVALMASGL